MLDATHFAEATIYQAGDPAQVIYRSLLAGYTENELNRLEDEIGTFSRTGLLPESVRALLDVGIEMRLAA